MEPLIESGKQWVAQWRLASTAARWALALAAVLASVAGLAYLSWPEGDTLVPLMGGDVQSTAPLTAAQLTAMEAAFGKAQLNEARVVGRSISVPRSKRHLYLKALVDQKALPAHAYAFTERFLANDHPFSSSRQREEAAKLAKAQEVSLILQKISGIEEASVLYEDTDLGGFPRQKTRKAVAAVRAAGGKPLPIAIITAIRGTVQATLGIQDQQSVTILDLNAGVTHTTSVAVAHERRAGTRPPSDAEANLQTVPNPSRTSTDRIAATSPTVSPGSRSHRATRHHATEKHAPEQYASHTDAVGTDAVGTDAVGTDTDGGDTAEHTAAERSSRNQDSIPRNSHRHLAPSDRSPLDRATNDYPIIAQAAFVTPDSPIDQAIDPILARGAGTATPSTLTHGPELEQRDDGQRELEQPEHERSEGSRAPAVFDPHVAAIPIRTRASTTPTKVDVNLAPPMISAEQDANAPLVDRDADTSPTSQTSSRRGVSAATLSPAGPQATGTGTDSPVSVVIPATVPSESASLAMPTAGIATSKTVSKTASTSASLSAPTSSHAQSRTMAASSTSRGSVAISTNKPSHDNVGNANGLKVFPPTAPSIANARDRGQGLSSTISTLTTKTLSPPSVVPQPVELRLPVAPPSRPLLPFLRLWFRDNLFTLAGSLVGAMLLARLVSSLRVIRRTVRDARRTLRAVAADASDHEEFQARAANARPTATDGEPSSRRRLREQIQADPSGAAAALKQWMGNAA